MFLLDENNLSSDGSVGQNLSVNDSGNTNTDVQPQKNDAREQIKELAKFRANRSIGNQANNLGSELGDRQAASGKGLGSVGGSKKIGGSVGNSSKSTGGMSSMIKGLSGKGGGSTGASKPSMGNKVKEAIANREGKQGNPDSGGVEEDAESKKPSIRGIVSDVKNAINQQQHGGGNPLDAAVGIIDKYAHVGKKLTFLTWVVWYLLAIVSVILSITIIGIPIMIIVMIILNIFIISPRTVYTISELILDFVGVGEVMQELDQAGLGKVEMKATLWQKASIILLDLVIVIVVAVMIIVFIKLSCDYFGYTQGGGILESATNTIRSTVIDISTGQEGTGAFLQGVCDSLGDTAAK